MSFIVSVTILEIMHPDSFSPAGIYGSLQGFCCNNSGIFNGITDFHDALLQSWVSSIALAIISVEFYITLFSEDP